MRIVMSDSTANTKRYQKVLLSLRDPAIVGAEKKELM
jgi:hypothetical protein